MERPVNQNKDFHPSTFSSLNTTFQLNLAWIPSSIQTNRPLREKITDISVLVRHIQWSKSGPNSNTNKGDEDGGGNGYKDGEKDLET